MHFQTQNSQITMHFQTKKSKSRSISKAKTMAGKYTLLDIEVFLKKKSQYLADRAGYCDFAFCYMCLFENNH